MAKDCLSDREKLKRFYVLTLWGVLNAHQANFRKRTKLLKVARWMLVAAGFGLVVAFLNLVWRHTTF